MPSWGRIQRAGAVALPVFSIAFLVARGACSPDVPFIRQRPEAPWITVPTVVTAQLQQWGREQVPRARFARSFANPGSDTDAVLRVRTLGRFEVRLDGRVVSPWSEETPLKQSATIPLELRAASHELSIAVANRHGPPLLSARLDGATPPLVSDASWRAEWEGVAVGSAAIADDTRINPLSLVVETPAEALGGGAVAVALWFALGVIAFVVAPRLEAGRAVRWSVAVLVAAAVGWSYLFVEKFLSIPLEVGFDARHHLHYVTFLRTHAAVPMATDGWSVYHPPLFYALALAAGWLGGLAGPAGEVAGLKLLPFLAGLANVWVAGALARRLLPDSGAQVAALLFAAVLPMNLYSAAYFSNETFHTLLAGVAMLWTVDRLLEKGLTPARVVPLAVLLGLCLVTKYTALLVTAVAAFFLLVKWLAVDRAPAARAVVSLALIATSGAVLAGWFYVRNWTHYGDPLMANWGSMPGPTLAWWQQPGFHTLAYFTGFGQSLVHPYLSAFHSFWDSVYSTLWGDAGIGGRVSPADRPAFWNYGYMSLGYLVALPATALIGVGVVRSLRTALGDADPHRRAAFSFLLTLSYAVLFGLLYLALRLPYFAQGKASYGLVVTAPLAVFFASGWTACESALRNTPAGWLRAVLWGWFAAFLASMFLAYAG